MTTMLGRVKLLTAVCVLAMAPVMAAADDILISNVTLIDGTGAQPLPNASVLVRDNRIALVSPSKISKPRGATEINGKGKFLLPGLIDTHIHLRGGMDRGRPLRDRALAIKTLHTFLYSGVTTVMDHGNDPEFIFQMRADEQAGKFVSPRLFAVGTAIHFPRPSGETPGDVIDSVAKVKGVLDEALSYDPDLIKIVFDGNDSLRGDVVPVFPEILEEIVHYSNRHGVGVTAHIGDAVEFQTVLDGGVNALAHAPISSVLDEAALKSAAVRRVPISTTAVVFNNIARVVDDISWLDTPLFKATLDADTMEFQKVAERERYRRSGMPAQFKPNMPKMIENMKLLHEAGALLALGSDRTYGPMSLQEIELYVDAGIPLLDCITIATRNAAIYIGKGDELGTVQRGKLADLVLFSRDPSADVANFASAETVIKDGKIVDLSALDLPINKK